MQPILKKITAHYNQRSNINNIINFIICTAQETVIWSKTFTFACFLLIRILDLGF